MTAQELRAYELGIRDALAELYVPLPDSNNDVQISLRFRPGVPSGNGGSRGPLQAARHELSEFIDRVAAQLLARKRSASI